MQSFFQDAFAQFGTIPKRGLYYIVAVSAASALSDIIFWSHENLLLAVDYGAFAVLCPAWIFVAYAASMSMIKSRLSLSGYLWFVAATLAIVLPGLVGLGLLLTMPSGWDRETTLCVFLVLIFVTLTALTFLPSWPISQAQAQSWVAPQKIFRATRGHRWSLFVMLFVGGGFNKLIPSISTANNIGTAGLIAGGNFIVNCASLMLTASIAVTSWRYAVKQDASLSGEDAAR